MTEYDALRQYDEMLNESWDTSICGREYETARTLREVDPVAYRCGFNDWLDSEGIDLDSITL